MTSRDRQPENFAPPSVAVLTGCAQDLRRLAEETLRQQLAKEPKRLAPMSAEDIQLILHELQVHQIELEIQNEELRRAQVELDATRERYFDLYDLAPIGYCTISEQGLLLEVNLTAATLLGINRGALIGKRISQSILNEDQDIYYLHRKLLIETGRLQTCELRMVKSDATVFWAHLTTLAAQETDGSAVHRIVLRDITNRKRAEEELRDSQTILTSVIENIPHMIFLKDSADLRFVLFNRAGEELLGYDRKTLLGKNNLDLFPPEQAAHFVAKDREVLDGPTGILDIPEEAISTAKKGQRLLHTKKVCIKNAEGTSKYLLGISEDITERKYLEEEQKKLQAQLQQAQKMESVGLLAGGVAHDFNNKLTIILGYTDMILGKVTPTEPLFADLQEIHRAAEHSADLTRQLLAFARKQVVMPKVLDLNDIVEGMLRMLRRLIGENIDLVWQPTAGLWPVKIDPSQIDQILANLCVNARDAIGGVGRLTIETANRCIDAAYCSCHPGFVPGEYVLLAINDDGCGMDQETLARIFEPFFTTKGVGQGTGLGLATVYGAVKQNDGFIDVDSQPGSGTTFNICLPRHRSTTVQVQQGVAAESDEGGRETILLVEDEFAILKMTSRMLQSLGYAVLAVNSPEEAMHQAKIHTGTIHLLVTDVIMPEMNGRDLAEHLVSLIPQLKCLLMSGYTADIISRSGKLDPGLHFIQKPFSKNELAAKVRAALAH